MAEVFHDHPSAVANTLEIAERCDLELGIDTGRYQMPEFQVPAGTTREEVLDGPGVGGAARAARARARRADPAQARRVREAHGARARRDHVDGLRGLLPDRGRLHRLRAAQRHSGRAGPRLGGGQPRGLVARDYRRRSDRVRHHLRAIPEPRADQHARHRRRLLHEGARPGDPLRRREVRRRGRRGPARRADHHVREAPGARRGARRGPRARHAVRRRRPDREADPRHARHHASTRRSSSRPSCARGSTPTARCASCSRPRASSRASRATRARTPPAS